MSFNQPRTEKREPPQYIKTGRSSISGLQRNYPGGKGGGGGSIAPPPSSSNNSSLSWNRSFKKSNNAQGVQSRVSSGSVSSDSNNAAAASVHGVQNGAHAQPPPPLQGASDAPSTAGTVKSTDISTQKSIRGVPKAPPSNASTITSNTVAPSAPAKDSSGAGGFSLQFGSISPGFMNGMQIPARTSSAPPNLDEQKRDQARHDSLRAEPKLPTPSIPKQQLPTKNAGAIDQSNAVEAQPMSKAKRDMQVSTGPPTNQTQKASVHPLSGIPMQVPYHQPQVQVQFGGPNPQLQSQGMANTSLPMPMHMPLPMGNPSQVQQQIFLSGLQPHMMQSQGIIPQGPTMNFSSQMGTQLPPQVGNMAINITPQFQQQQAGKFGGPRKAVKITHPDTHEELRLDKRADTYADGGSSGPRSHPNVLPHSQPIPSFQPHAINYYPKSYNPSLFFPVASSVPLTSTQITPSSQAPRFYNQVSQGPPALSFTNPSSLNSFSVNKTGAPLHGMAESSNLEHARDLHNVISSHPLASTQVTVKPASNLRGEKGAESSLPMSSPAVEKGVPKILRPLGESSSLHNQRDSENLYESSLQQSKSMSTPEPRKPSIGVSDFVCADSLMTKCLSSASPALVEHPTSVASSTTEGTSREIVNRSDSNNEQKQAGTKGYSLAQNQVGQQSTSGSTLSSGEIVETVEAITSPPLLGSVGPVHDTTREPLATSGVVTSAAPDSKTEKSGIGRTWESTKMLSADSIDVSLENEIPKPEATNTNERGEIMFPEESKDDSRFEITPKAISFKFSGSVDQTEKNTVLAVTMTSSETGSMETAQQKLEEEPVVSCREGEVASDLVTSTSAAVDTLIFETSSLNLGLSTISHGDRASASDTSIGRGDVLGSTESSTTESGMIYQKPPVVSIPSHSEATSSCESEVIDSNSIDLLSPQPGSKHKPLLEPNRAKNTLAKAKKKRREALQKADRAGTSSDLYMAYKGPEEIKETDTPSESRESTSSIFCKQLSADTSQEGVPNGIKAEPDDWEDAADISTPKLETSDDWKQVGRGMIYQPEDGNSMAKKYSRDFLLKFSEQCADLPEGFEITSDIAEALIVSNGNVPRESYPSPGRNIDRPMGGPRLDRRGSGLGDDDKWSKVPGPLASVRDLRLDIGYGGNTVGFRPGQGGNYGVLRNPRAQSPIQFAGGILSGPMSMGPQGGMQRNNSDSDRWQRATGFQKGLIPSPQTPLQVMHKAEKKYEVGKITDKEQAKQRQLKAILNKLTPQNFEKLFEQVKQVNIDNTGTLAGVISQIFDKALTEPTFCEMYADFCYHLAGDLPDFNEDNEKITFKRLLLNKCQEEFEKGVREQEEANRAEEDGEAKQSEEEREEKRIQARRRMLGNIRLIGELYKKKMLTERIMHECIQQLLGQDQNPEEEDVEALCKLMSTIGEMIDHPRAKEHMDFYFDIMTKSSNNMKLSSRVRFMLKDSIDLRKNKWQQRRKVEGPKKIEEVHRDAANERQAQASRPSRGPSMGSSFRRGQQPMDFAPRGSNILSSPNAQMGGFRGLSQQPRGYGIQDARSDERHSFDNRTISVPLPQRPLGDDSITLGPQGGLARGMSIRGQLPMSNNPPADMHSADSRRITTGLNGYNSISERPAYASREELMPRYLPDRFVSPAAHDQMNSHDRNMSFGSREFRNPDRIFDRSRPNTAPTRSREPTSMENVSSEKVWPEERLRDLSMLAIKEFYSAKDENEVVVCVKDLHAPSFYPSMISIWVTDSFERKDMERDLLAKLLINLTKSQDAILSQDQLVEGFESVLASLEDAVTDAPKAAEFLGGIFAKVILENVIPLTEIERLIYDGGEEQGRLVETGLAAKVHGSILEIIKLEKGDPTLNEICKDSGLRPCI